MITGISVITSVADPDPVESGLFGSGSGKIPDPDPLSTKDRCNSNFVVI